MLIYTILSPIKMWDDTESYEVNGQNHKATDSSRSYEALLSPGWVLDTRIIVPLQRKELENVLHPLVQTPIISGCSEFTRSGTVFLAERQTSLEQASFDGSQVGSRMFAKAPLLPASFLPLLYLSSEIAPALIIFGSEFLNREALPFAGHSSHHANRAADHHPRYGSPSARGSSLMNPRHAKAMLQFIVGAR